MRPDVPCNNVVTHEPGGFPLGFRSLCERVSGGFQGVSGGFRHSADMLAVVFFQTTTHFATRRHRGKRFELREESREERTEKIK